MSGKKENDFVLCTVRKIEGTSVFLEIAESPLMGSMILSEVAAGRIRNLGDYVFPGKKIVCKILKVYKDHIELSLRRVSTSEREEVMERYKKEKAIKKILASCIKDATKVINEITGDHDLVDFIEEGRQDPSIFNKYFSQEEVKKILPMIKEKAEKQKIVGRRFSVRSNSERGVLDIKEILDTDGEIHYQGSAVFSIRVSAENFKEAENKLSMALGEISARAKKKSAVFEMIKEK